MIRQRSRRLSRPEFRIRMRADGDGRGGGSPVTTALTNALNAAKEVGGIVIIPDSGTGFYNLPDQISGDFSDVTIQGEGAATLDVTNWIQPGLPQPDQDFSIQSKGSLGTPISFTSQVDMGSDVLPLVDVTGIVPGTILQLTSTINSLTADIRAGVWDVADVLKWRLGNATVGVTGFLPYSEFATVKGVSGNNVTLTGPVKWKYPVVAVPSYGSGPTVSTATVVTPVRNFWIKNLNFTRYDATQLIGRGTNITQFINCIDSGIVGGTYELGQRRGAAARFIGCIDTIGSARTTHTYGYDPSLDHAAYNSWKFVGCRNHTLILDDVNGSQGGDSTYLSATQAPYNTINMNCCIMGKSEGNLEGWTSHGGGYGLRAGPFVAIKCGRVFVNRDAYATISDQNGYNCSDPDDGAFGFGAFAINCTFSDSNLYGTAFGGLQVDRKVLDEIAPPWIGLKVNNVNIYDCPNYAARLVSPVVESNTVAISVASPAVITQAGGTFVYYGCPVTFSTTGSLPTGLAINTLYYVKDKLSDSTYTVSATLGGAAINTTVAGSGTQTANWQAANADPSGIVFTDCNFQRVNTGVRAEEYVNYVEWHGGDIELTGASPVGFRGDANTIGHKIRGLTTYDEGDTAAIGILCGTPTGTIGDLVFPIATYPTIRLDIGEYGANVNRHVGSGQPTAINSIRGLYNFQAGATYTFMMADVFQSVYCSRTTTSQTLTVALDGSGAGELQWVDGAQIEINVLGTAIGPTVAGAVGVTIEAPQGLVIPTGARAYLKRRTTNQWKLSIITSAQTIGASYIDVGAAIGGSDTLDFVPLLQAFYASSDANGKHLIYKRSRAWVSPAKPTTGLGPQGQYLTPPQYSTHEWEPGALWDFSAYTTTGSVVYFRPADGSLGTAMTVSGTVAAGAKTITVGAGQAAGLTIGARLLLLNTTQLTTLVGAFTLVDAFGTLSAARGETVIVQSVSGDVITLANRVRDTYDTTATPLLYPYQNEPRLKLINPTMLAPSGTNGHYAILVGSGRDFQSDGGTLTSFGGAFMIGINSIMGGHVNDLTMVSNEGPGDAGGGLAIAGDTTAFKVTNCRSYGGSQMFMLTVDSPFYGVTRDILFEGNNAYSPMNGFSTHNMHEHITYLDNFVYGSSGAGIDIRCPNCVVRGGVLDRTGVLTPFTSAFIFRINPAGLVVDGLTIRNAYGGIELADFTTNWDYPPSNITIRNIDIENVGGTGNSRGISCSYSQAPGTTLGPLTISNIDISMNDNNHAVVVGGKWKSPKIDGLRVIAATGASPAGRSVLMDGAGNGAGEGPIDPFARVTQSSTYAVPSITDFTGQMTLSTGVEGTTTSRLAVLASSTTLSAEQGMTPANSGIFINTGASARVDVTMPLASSPRMLKFQFNVVDADGFKLIAQVGDTFQIGSGAPGASGGSLTSTTIGAWCIVTAVSSVKWIAQVDDPANWTLL